MIYEHVERLTLSEIQALPAVISTRETSGILGRQPHTVQRWAREGRIPSSKVGSRLMFSKATVCKLAGIDCEGA